MTTFIKTQVIELCLQNPKISKKTGADFFTAPVCLVVWA